MCGVLFAYYRNNKNHFRLNLFLEREVNNFLKNRGPTFQDIYKSENFFAYQSVLSIQSSKSRSNQLPSLGSNEFMLYNGEIYGLDKNKDISDTEYIGDILFNKPNSEELISKLDGMFIISHFKRFKNNQIESKIYRDPIGEKHLWYYIDKEIFLISSVPSIITNYLRNRDLLTINKNVLNDYLLRRHLISPSDHIINEVKQLKAGHKLEFNSKAWIVKEQKYFNFHCLFNQTIQLMELSKPLDYESASIISGGLDSSIVSASLCSISENRDLYTMIFKNKDPVANNVSNLLKFKSKKLINHHKEIPCEIEYYKNKLLRSIDILSSPINTHSIPSAYIVAENARNNKNIILYGGEGADEVFLGYECYSPYKNIISKYNSINSNFSFDYNLHENVKQGPINNYIKSLKNYYYEIFNQTHNLGEKESQLKVESIVDIVIQLSNVGLITTDTINSDLGIESRTPFTRRKLVEFGLSSPISKLINYSNNNQINKIPIKYVFENYFSKDLLMPKKGFAGFPNESKKYLGNVKTWLVWDQLKWHYSEIKNMTITEEWKVVNIEWFLRRVIDNKSP